MAHFVHGRKCYQFFILVILEVVLGIDAEYVYAQKKGKGIRITRATFSLPSGEK